jgi:chemotaxis signal transduction protein
LSAPEAAAQEAGSSVPQAWLQQLQSLSTSQDYAVTPFEPTDFHAQGATYVYLAALRTETGQALLGGVAIVFNSARELGAMLRDILGERQGVAAFVDASGRVLAATDDALAVGVANAFTGEAGVVEHAGVHYACARVRACGYREFKASDRYDNGVHAVVGLRLGASERRRQNFSQLDLNSAAAAGAAAVQTELAVFQVAAMRYALPVAALLEAVEPGALVRTPSTREAALGMAAVDTPQGSRLVQVLCARQLLGVAYPAREHDGVLLVLRPPPGHTDPQALVALRVDDVLSVLEVSPAQVHPAPPELRQYATWVDALVDCEVSGAGRVDRVLIQRLSHDQLWRELTDPAPTAHPVDPADEAQDAAVADLVD